MLKFVLATLVACLASDEFETRQHAHRAIEMILTVSDETGPVLDGLEHRDPEVVYRCRRILEKYNHIDVPDELRLEDFDDPIPKLVSLAKDWAWSQQAEAYVYYLGPTRKPSSIRRVVAKAREKMDKRLKGAGK